MLELSRTSGSASVLFTSSLMTRPHSARPCTLVPYWKVRARVGCAAAKSARICPTCACVGYTVNGNVKALSADGAASRAAHAFSTASRPSRSTSRNARTGQPAASSAACSAAVTRNSSATLPDFPSVPPMVTLTFSREKSARGTVASSRSSSARSCSSMRTGWLLQVAVRHCGSARAAARASGVIGSQPATAGRLVVIAGTDTNRPNAMARGRRRRARPRKECTADSP